MSKYGTLETEIKEQKYLSAALAEMGYQPEVHPDGAAAWLATRVISGRRRRTSSYAGTSWTRRQTISASQRWRTADMPRSSVNTTRQSGSTRNG